MANPNPPTIPNAEDELNWKKLLEYTTIVQNLSDRISSLQKSAFTLANYYFVSQAVVFTALCSNSSLVCRDVWFPLFVSLLPGALNLFAFFKIGQEYIKTVISQKKFKILTRDHGVHKSGHTLTSLMDDEDTEYVEEREKERLTRNLCWYMYAFGLLAAVVASGILWMLCWKSWHAFVPLAAVVAFGILWLVCRKSFIFMLRRIYSSTMPKERSYACDSA